MDERVKSQEVTKTGPDAQSSRRKFLTVPAAGGVVAAAVGGPGALFAATQGSIPSIRIPKEVATTLTEPPTPGSSEDKGMAADEGYAKLCKPEWPSAMSCWPGTSL